MGNDASRPMGGGGEELQSPRSPGEALTPRTPSTARRLATPSTPTATSSSATVPSNNSMNRTIQRMDKMIRKRVRGGITYNMKLVIRGDKGTGKTSLFRRLKGEPIPESHVHTSQIEVATINWNSRQSLEENVKCEVWDVADRSTSGVNGFNTGEDESLSNSGSSDAGTSPGSASELPAVVASPGGAASASPASTPPASMSQVQKPGEIYSTGTLNGTHLVANVDSSTVDVYHETHGVIFVLDITKWNTLEYVRAQLEKVPVHIPTLVIGNFRDCGNQRKIFKEDITELLYGSDRIKVLRRPQELLYFECSFRNCYGLKALHKYFGIPFLQLKLATLRQQMRLLEGEFAHLKHDLQANISEQRYTDYIEHIRTTGSDIRTGKRATAATKTDPVASSSSSPSTEDPPAPAKDESEAAEDVSVVKADEDRDERRDIDAESTIEKKSKDAREQASGAVNSRQPIPSAAPVPSHQELEPESSSVENDMGDLPDRVANDVLMQQMPLKIVHMDSQQSMSSDQNDQKEEVTMPPEQSLQAASSLQKEQEQETTKKKKKPRTKSIDKVAAKPTARLESIEDFQVKSELDHFYSSDEDSEEEDEDQDVVIPAARPVISGKKLHKQQFLYSDDEESDIEDDDCDKKPEVIGSSGPLDKSDNNSAPKPQSKLEPVVPQEKSALEKHIEEKMHQECLNLMRQTSNSTDTPQVDTEEDSKTECTAEDSRNEELDSVPIELRGPEEKCDVVSPSVPVRSSDDAQDQELHISGSTDVDDHLGACHEGDQIEREDEDKDKGQGLGNLEIAVDQTDSNLVSVVPVGHRSPPSLPLSDAVESSSMKTSRKGEEGIVDDNDTDEFVVPLDDQHALSDDSDYAPSDQEEQTVSEPEPSEPSEPQQPSPQHHQHKAFETGSPSANEETTKPANHTTISSWATRDLDLNQHSPKSPIASSKTSLKTSPDVLSPTNVQNPSVAVSSAQLDSFNPMQASTTTTSLSGNGGVDLLSGFKQPRDLLDDFFSDEEDDGADMQPTSKSTSNATFSMRNHLVQDDADQDDEEEEVDDDDRFARFQMPKKSRKERRKHKSEFLLMEEEVTKQQQAQTHAQDQQDNPQKQFAYDASVLEAIERARQEALANFQDPFATGAASSSSLSTSRVKENDKDRERSSHRRDRKSGDGEDKKKKKTKKKSSSRSSRSVVE